MELEYLPIDAFITAVRGLSAKDIINLCQSNSVINAKCKSPEFIENILRRKYRLYHLTNIPGNTLQEKYDYVLQSVNTIETLQPDSKYSYDDILDEALQLQNAEFTALIYRKIFQSWGKYYDLQRRYIPGNSYEEKYKYIVELFKHAYEYNIHRLYLNQITQEQENKNFVNILIDTVLLRGQPLLEFIIYILFSRIHEDERYKYLPSFSGAVLYALIIGDPKIINILLKYYNHTEQKGFKDLVMNEILHDKILFTDEDLHLFKNILPYIAVNKEDFYTTIQNNKFKFGDFIREFLIAEGRDPLLDQDAVDGAFADSVVDENKEVIKYLFERGAHLNMDVLSEISPEMLKYLNDLLNKK